MPFLSPLQADVARLQPVQVTAMHVLFAAYGCTNQVRQMHAAAYKLHHP